LRVGDAPTVVDRGTAGPAYPGTSELALRMIGINEFVLLTDAPAGSAPGRGEPRATLLQRQNGLRD